MRSLILSIILAMPLGRLRKINIGSQDNEY